MRAPGPLTLLASALLALSACKQGPPPEPPPPPVADLSGLQPGWNTIEPGGNTVGFERAAMVWFGLFAEEIPGTPPKDGGVNVKSVVRIHALIWLEKQRVILTSIATCKK